jgi:hypothetical protein
VTNPKGRSSKNQEQNGLNHNDNGEKQLLADSCAANPEIKLPLGQEDGFQEGQACTHKLKS